VKGQQGDRQIQFDSCKNSIFLSSCCGLVSCLSWTRVRERKEKGKGQSQLDIICKSATAAAEEQNSQQTTGNSQQTADKQTADSRQQLTNAHAQMRKVASSENCKKVYHLLLLQIDEGPSEYSACSQAKPGCAGCPSWTNNKVCGQVMCVSHWN